MYIIEVSRGCPDVKYPLNGIFEFDQAKALAALEHKVVFAAVDVRSIRRWRKWGIHRFEKDGILVYSFSFPVGAVKGLDAVIQKLGFSLLFRKIVKEQGMPDLVHAHFGDFAGCVTDTCINTNLPYVVTEHSSAVNVDVMPEKQKDVLTKTYAEASQVIAVSSSLKDRIKFHTGIDAVVVPNIVDLSMFGLKKPKTADGIIRYISAGNLVHGKGFDVLLKAFSLVLKKHPAYTLMIMGGGPEEGKLKAQAKNLGIEKNVTFYGAFHRAEFADELAESDVFVLASRGETFGVVYIEALACGLPVIATRCGGPEDFISETNGILVPVDDAQVLSEAMLRLADNIDQYDKAAISQHVRQSFSTETVANTLSRNFVSVVHVRSSTEH